MCQAASEAGGGPGDEVDGPVASGSGHSSAAMQNSSSGQGSSKGGM